MTTNTRDNRKGNGGPDGLLKRGRADDGMVQMQIRIPPELKRALEDEAEGLTNRYGVPVSTSGVLRKLLAEGLQRAKGEKTR